MAPSRLEKVEVLRESGVGPVKNMPGTCNRNCRSLQYFFINVIHITNIIMTIILAPSRLEKVEVLRESGVGPVKNMPGTCNRNCRSL